MQRGCINYSFVFPWGDHVVLLPPILTWIAVALLFYDESDFFPMRLAQFSITPIILLIGFLMCDESGKNEK